MKLRDCIVKTLAWGLGTIIVLETIWLAGANYALNKFFSADLLTEQINSKTKINAVFEDIKYTAKPNFSISINAKNIQIDQDKNNIAKLEDLDTNINILPIIFNKVYLSKLDAKLIYLNIIKDKNGEINILKLLPENIPIPDIKKLHTDIDTYKIKYYDEILNKSISFDGKDFNIYEFCTNKKISLSTKGIIQSNKNISEIEINFTSRLPVEKNLTKKDFNLNLKLDNLNLSGLTPFVKYIPNTKIQSLNGNITALIKTATDAKTREKLLLGDIITNNIYIKEDLLENDSYLNEKTDINFKLSLLPKDIDVKSFNLNNENHNIDITGKIYNVTNKKPELDLKIKLHNDIKSMIYNIVPSELEFENRMLAKIKKYKPKATVDGEITIKGDCLEPDIEGEFSAPDLFIDLPDTKIAHATIKLTFLKDKIHLFTHVIPGKTGFVDVEGMIDMYGKKRGIFDVNTSKNVDLKLTRAVLMPIQDTFSLNFSVLNYIYAQKGEGDAKLHIDGTKYDATIDGRLNFYNGHANFDGINTYVNNINGFLNFKGKNADFATTSADINGDKISISGTGSALGPFSVDISSNSISTNSLLNILLTSPMLTPITKDLKELNEISQIKGKSNLSLNVKGFVDIFNPVIDFDKMQYNGSLIIKNSDILMKKLSFPIKIINSNIDFSKQKINATANGKISESPINVEVLLNNKNLEIKKIIINTFGSNILINGKIGNYTTNTPNFNINADIKNFNLKYLNNLKDNHILLSKDLKKIISAYGDYKGIINGEIQYKNNGLNGNIHASDIGLTHKKMQLPLAIENADLILKNDTLVIQSLNATVDNVPLYANLSLKDFTKKPYIKGYLTTNLYPSFLNKYINANLRYPIKLKGEMRTKSYFEGYPEAIKSTTIFSFPIGSDLSYMGANLDEEDFAREFRIELQQKPDELTINKAVLAKYIPAINGEATRYPYLTAFGKIKNFKNPTLSNFKIKTAAKTSSKFLNILFKKSIIKNGDFECNLNINGEVTNPKILGFVKFNNLELPLYETNIKEFLADFKSNNVSFNAIGNIYNTNITASANTNSTFKPPFKIKNININADYLDLDKIFDSISKVAFITPHGSKGTENTEFFEAFKPQDITIDKGVLNAKTILVKGFPATDLSAEFHQNADGVLRIEDFDFQIAQGTVNAKGLYNLNTSHFTGDCIAKSIDANQFAQLFLNLKNQIYGLLDGTVNFSTTGITQEDRIKNLDGKVTFKISDGKMPKLGSLEYLLRAGNIVKSGITGFTANNIIELLVPIKTGEFSSISGLINITTGTANDIQIYSQGKNLSLYIRGSAELIEPNAQMNVYGRLSKKVSTLLGPIGNTSLNTLFNLIPGIKLADSNSQIIKDVNKIPMLELSNDAYRFFQATIDGNINGNNYVRTFKWLE